jgi:hypothetical protein
MIDDRTLDLFTASGPTLFGEWIQTRQGRAVYRYFKHFTFRLARVGKKRYSARQICGRIRWHVEVDRNEPADEFKVNNNYTPDLARKFMEENPQFEGFFETRELKRRQG